MAKLYWRVKKDGKWTWTAAKFHKIQNYLYVKDYENKEDEEE